MNNINNYSLKVKSDSFSSPVLPSPEGLGNNSKIPSSLLNVARQEEKSSMINENASCVDFSKQKMNRKEKYSLRRTAKTLLCKDNSFKSLKSCGVTPIASTVSVYRSADHNLSYYNSIAHCNSVWSCPVCSSKIASVRVAEVEHCIDTHLRKNKYIATDDLNKGRELLSQDTGVYMITLTASHHKGDSLEYIEKKLTSSKQGFWRDGSVRRLIKTLNYVGRITSHEVTYSNKNGFHPHDHILLFTDHIGYCRMKKVESKLRKIWRRYLKINGLYGNQHCFSFKGGNYTSQYVSKMGLETTLGHVKRGKIINGIEHFSPFQLLNYIREHDWKEPLTKEYIRAFKEFSISIKGKTQLMYSRGLKDHFKLNILSDQEANSATPIDSKLVLTFKSSDYKKLNFDDLNLLVLNYFDRAAYSHGINLLVKAGVQVIEINEFVLNILKKEGINIQLE